MKELLASAETDAECSAYEAGVALEVKALEKLNEEEETDVSTMSF